MKELILIGLAAMKITDLGKELIPFPVAAWTKSVAAGLACLVLGLLAGTEILVIVGAWGLSALAHELQGVLAMASDNFKQQIMLRAAVRRREIR